MWFSGLFSTTSAIIPQPLSRRRIPHPYKESRPLLAIEPAFLHKASSTYDPTPIPVGYQLETPITRWHRHRLALPKIAIHDASTVVSSSLWNCFRHAQMVRSSLKFWPQCAASISMYHRTSERDDALPPATRFHSRPVMDYVLFGRCGGEPLSFRRECIICRSS